MFSMKKRKVMCIQVFTKKNGEPIPDPNLDDQPRPGDIDFVLADYPASHPLNVIGVNQYTLERFGEDNGFAISHFIDVTDIDEAVVGTIADTIASMSQGCADEITFRRREPDGYVALKTYRLWKIQHDPIVYKNILQRQQC